MIGDIDKQVEELIINHAGLQFRSLPPTSWDLFLGHSRLISIALTGQSAPPIDEYSYFPSAFDGDVTDDYNAIRAEIEKLLSGAQV